MHDDDGWRRGDPQELIDADVDLASFVRRLTPAWHRDALCREFDVDLWFPTKGQSTQPAIDICGRCSVRSECLDEALADESLDHGVRGGMTAATRRQRRKANRRNS